MLDFQEAEARPQALLDATLFHQWFLQDGSLWTDFYRAGETYLLRFPGLADFQLTNDGGHIQAWPVPDVPSVILQHLFLNQVLPLALSRQGKLVFHGSGVEVGGGCIAFIGDTGRGKSTLAASFGSSGFRFLTDDALLVEPDGEEYRILPSHPSFRLWEDSEVAVAGEGAQKAPPLPYTPKSRFFANERFAFCPQPRRLRRVYFLGEGVHQEPSFERMSPGEVLVELVRHSLLLDIEKHEMLAAHFDGLSHLSGLPLFYRLDYPRRYDELPQIRQAIVDHARLTENDAA